MSYFRNLVKGINDENTNFASDGLSAGQFTGTVDTGSYIFNALLSGSIYGGMPNNKILALAGESATGKTFFALGIVKQFLDDNPDAAVFYFDTEAAITKDMMLERGIDAERVIISEPESVQSFRHTALQILDKYGNTPKDERPPMMMVLDSLGQLSTTKELEDTMEGKETRDMTRAQVLKAAFRVLTLKLAKVQVPMVVTNHVYDVVGCVDGMQRILLSDGTYKNICDMAIGDKVKTLNGNKEIMDLFEYDVEEYHELVLDDGHVIKCTPNHEFLLKTGEWVRADELRDGDDIAELGDKISYSAVGKAA